jgi:ion transport protein
MINTRSNRTKSNSRISTVEIAIRAYAKRFLAHPLVVQQLEAVWSGAIVFHSTADTLHRLPEVKKPSPGPSGYGTVGEPVAFRTISYANPPGKGKSPVKHTARDPVIRRTASLYDPSDASLFKLSRLRVPRYRQLFSTLSYAVMLGLFLAVLIERSHDITALELVFWFWSAGYMLDEVVGFSEQGFGLYIISVWNSFDIGILLMFIAYYVLRLYGILVPDDEDQWIVNISYDVLASTAVLLFPRLFSVLDHYRYFSQLLIAFRMMAVDLAAILILIVISCSGFFAAFTLSFTGKDFNSNGAAYVLFQILMGFTPAAWEIWDDYNFLGKAILVVFLIICHFLIVTILITVLTNSFMAIVQNANEEHQFLFAVNTISMVKSDALFSYVPPTNIIGWALSPLRLILPFRLFVKWNRIIIKATHVPILFVIFLYERIILTRHVYEPTDLVEQRGREPSRVPGFSVRGPGDLFSPGARLREPSVATFHKDQALEEVFRRPFQGTNVTADPDLKRRDSVSRSKAKTVVQDWMRNVGREGGAASPANDPPVILDRLENRRPQLRRHRTHNDATRLGSLIRSVASDPEEHPGPIDGFHYLRPQGQLRDNSMSDILIHSTDEDGDDELATNEEDEAATQDQSFEELVESASRSSDKENRERNNMLTPSRTQLQPGQHRKPLSSIHGSAIESSISDGPGTNEDPVTPVPTRIGKLRGGSDDESPEQPVTQQRIPSKRDRSQHIRTASSATILFAPLDDAASSSKTPISTSPTKARTTRSSARNSATLVANTPSGLDGSQLQLHVHPRASHTGPSSSAAIGDNIAFGPPLSSRLHGKGNKSAPNLASLLALERRERQPSFSAMALDLASDLGDNRAVPDAGMLLSGSFGTQWEMQALGRRRRRGLGRRQPLDEFAEDDEEDDDDDAEVASSGALMMGMGRQRNNGQTRRLNRLMLARMTTLEEGFREVLREVRGLSSASRAPTSVAGSEPVNRAVRSDCGDGEMESVLGRDRSSV